MQYDESPPKSKESPGNSPVSLFVCAGEVSGDQRGSELIAAYLKMFGPVNCFGAGGDLLEAEGVRLTHHVDELSVMGIQEVLRHGRSLSRARRNLARLIREKKPDAAVLVDYPGMNLRLARSASRAGVPVFYYISPKIWAWGGRRIKKIRRWVDLMTVIFPFEESIYRQAGVPVFYTGHPLQDLIPERRRSARKDLIALLPGSRIQEIVRILPVMLRTGELLQEESDRVFEFVIARSANIPSSLYESILRLSGLHARVLTGRTHHLLEGCGAAIVASGTATLEASLAGAPMVVVYRTGRLTYVLGKALLKAPYISLVNLVAERRLVAELIQHEASPERLKEECLKLLQNGEYLKGLTDGYAEVRRRLAPPVKDGRTAAERAADALHGFLTAGSDS